MKIFIIILLILTIITLVISYVAYGKSGKIKSFLIQNPIKKNSKELTLLSINMAHGRGDGRNQILQSNKVIKTYVKKIADIIKKENADVVALQEADAPSWWSGDFSHVNYVAEHSAMSFALQGKHVNGLGLQYGASLVTKLNVTEAISQTFERSIPTFSKGFVMATCQWNDLTFDVVSLHLDFSRESVRVKQLELLAQKIKENHRPLIVMGDFNTDMSKELLPNFMKKLHLHTWKPNDKSIITFPSFGGARLDWVLVSSEFEILTQEVLDDVVSDHKVVKVVLKLKSNS